jgi:phosphoglycerate dehydrogenase-like enzyme
MKTIRPTGVTTVLNILYPDAQFTGDPEIETAVFGDQANLHIYRARSAGEIPEDLWRECDAAVCYHDMEIGAGTISQMQRCRQIVRAGVGFDQIDIAACARNGIPVCNTPDYGTTDVADHAIAMMLALARGIVTYHEQLKQDPRDGWNFMAAPTVRRLAGQVFGVVGLGRIGTATALRAKAFGMDVVFYDPYRESGVELALGIRRVDSLSALLRQADVVTLHVPLTEETRNLMDAKAFSLLRPGALLINTARGPVVEIKALLHALLSGKLAGAALDVLPIEPPSSNDPLIAAWQDDKSELHRRLILSPHAAFYSSSSLRDVREKSAKVAVDYLLNGKLRNCVNGLDAIGVFRR